MIIKPEIIERINGSKTPVKKEMQEEMGYISIQAVNLALATNRHNSWLTSKPVLEIISRNLNVDVSDIVTETPKTEPQSCNA